MVNRLRVPSQNSQNFISDLCSLGKRLSTTKDTGSGKGLSTTKVGGPLRHNSFHDPELEYRGYPETNGRGLDLRRFGPLVDDDDVYQSNESFKTIRTEVPPSNKPSIPQSNVHLSNEPVLTNVPQSNKLFHTIPTDMRGSFEHAYQLLTSYFAEVRYRGTLLTTIAIDPSNHIFPLAFSITDSETTESWTYFLKMFGSNFYGYDTRFVIIPDRNPKIINVVPKVLPFAIHTFCAFHISNNITTTHESTRIAFRMAAEALTSIDFDKHMNTIRNTDLVGLQYILGIPKEIMYNLYIPMSRYGVAYTNHVESWNNVILKVKDLPIHMFIEELRKIYSKMFYTYREEAEKSQARLTPWATDHYGSRKFMADSLTCRVCRLRHHF
ncbi:hypothetical protein GIB67_015930 [Kingdonia uniflora]|uniref:MULE transposase domain-containing protein n=1 Tax=Kingdonia uniflora TaxID=39325 RepID=A0A7J7PC76_9MAGN|nr:hypothetical protein GIB67_015930 [Kingdonia uniflora]